MAAIFGTSASAAYLFFVHSLYQQLDSRLLTLAQSAAPSLTAVKIQGDEHLDERAEIPWQELFRRNQQSLTWFDLNGRELATRGAIQVSLPVRTGILTLKRQQIRTFTIPVYLQSSDLPIPTLEGYIRASESTKEIEEVIAKLRWGLGLGGIVALGLSGIGGVWLVQKSLLPTQQSFEQLKQFTADASHELRSPLTAVKTSIEVILKHPERIHPKDSKKLFAIASATNQMTHLVEDLLFLARTDAAVMVLNNDKAPIYLYKVLQDLLALLDSQAQQRGITFQSDLLPDVMVIGDAARLTRLFSNLLENALQYTSSGGTVTLSMKQGSKHVVVSVQDTGIGIAPERIRLVFQRFWRADRARSHRAGGLGLGLAIAQAIAQQHNGEITVNSRVGEGSCFRVRLPLANG
ncbi:cell wall metabolism sensor histidine kinase WalK [Oculatella sp. LEGE 06141]|uniref:sensor histidine kinase n=1 Tax=Oculatella sp. LEGE 06141 TaxID=1828648 RepID=UPI001D150DA8|nr:HAMP domain-containing sensor histidine kinase [Oculatella sp. LEGE 06141]